MQVHVLAKPLTSVETYEHLKDEALDSLRSVRVPVLPYSKLGMDKVKRGLFDVLDEMSQAPRVELRDLENWTEHWEERIFPS